MSLNEAACIMRKYVCACCWGPLRMVKIDARTAGVACLKGDDCSGKNFVTARWAERRRLESKIEYYEVRELYPDLVKCPTLHPELTAEAREQKILQELGF